MGTTRYLFLLWMCLSALTQALASHVAGGDLVMTPAGAPGVYRITFNQYFDEQSANAGAKMGKQNDVSVTITDADGRTLQSITLKYNYETRVYASNPICFSDANQETTYLQYEGTVTLDPEKYKDDRGYILKASVCRRNSTIVNISGPANTCSEFVLNFPPLIKNGQPFVNASARFVPPNGEVICRKEPFKMKFAATDPDGDQLLYQLVPPRGVLWNKDYDSVNMIPGSPSLQIDPTTGYLTVTADAPIGLHIFAVEVSEIRNGEKIGSVLREYQLFVLDCPPSQLDPLIYTREDSLQNASQGANWKGLRNLDFCKEKVIELRTQYDPTWGYQWQKDGENIPNAISNTYKATQAGDYSVVVSFRRQCTTPKITENLTLKIKQVQVEAKWDSIKVICGNDIAPIPLTATPAGGVYDGVGLSTDNKFFSPQVAGFGKFPVVYTVIDPATNCQVQATRWFVVSQVPIVRLGLDLTITQGDSLRPRWNVSTGATYTWTPTTGISNPKLSSPIFSPQQTTTYKLTATYPNSCANTDDITIIVNGKLLIANAFTPNDDGTNDVWELRGIENYPEAEVLVFNRWGKEIFTSRGYTQPFDGKQNGEFLPTATYYYYIKPDSSQKPLTGTLTILR